ncbi:protein NDL1-like, partial [Camellia sinensis]|uniref:protein NDL1-like n=1 Tax=Camellia sinensis TaxID=4442 RepID=UPI0010357D08
NATNVTIQVHGEWISTPGHFGFEESLHFHGHPRSWHKITLVLQVLLNLLYFYGVCGRLKECLLHRYFSKELRSSTNGAESDVIQACRRLLDERQSLNVMRFLQAMNERHDLTEALKKLPWKTLIFVGDCSPFHTESVYMNAMMEKKICPLVEVQSCGSLVTEEHPYAMLIPIEVFLMGFGLEI